MKKTPPHHYCQNMNNWCQWILCQQFCHVGNLDSCWCLEANQHALQMYILCALLGDVHCNHASIVICKQSDLIWSSNDEQDVCVIEFLLLGQ